VRGSGQAGALNFFPINRNAPDSAGSILENIMFTRQKGISFSRVLALVAMLAIGAIIGIYGGIYGRHSLPGTHTVSQGVSAEPEILYWVAPMDPDYRRDKPGKSPMGMDLVPVYADGGESEHEDEPLVRINPAVEHNLGIRTQVAEIRPLWRRIEATGYVGFDENLLSHIHMRTDGWVERVLVDAEGERVKRGQLLFEY
jgi:Cu(I)/Ag(I) efflux system membrane fusion protein